MQPTDLVITRPLGATTGISPAVVLNRRRTMPSHHASLDRPTPLVVTRIQRRQRRQVVLHAVLHAPYRSANSGKVQRGGDDHTEGRRCYLSNIVR